MRALDGREVDVALSLELGEDGVPDRLGDDAGLVRDAVPDRAVQGGAEIAGEGRGDVHGAGATPSPMSS
jgi:hypothetical protein